MIRLDHEIIAGIIEPGARVLDLGCGNGDLLAFLKEQKGVRGTGIEIDEEEVLRCLERGVAVTQGNINDGLGVYGDKRFDYVIFNESLQQVLKIDKVLGEALRVGRHVIVGIPNFCHLGARLQLFFRGRVPVTKSLPFHWYDTPNLRFLSLKDFRSFCAKKGISIERARYLTAGKEVVLAPNLLAEEAIFVIRKD
ncbi:MAG: methionine biosynthesis protein MetW [Elusimicrobia bacterium]|nr:methionine biosynthesis protein MetW [Elusimicrobiota bacterium]